MFYPDDPPAKQLHDLLDDWWRDNKSLVPLGRVDANLCERVREVLAASLRHRNDQLATLAAAGTLTEQPTREEYEQQIHKLYGPYEPQCRALLDEIGGKPPTVPPRVGFDDDTLTVTLDGKAHQVSDPLAYRVYKAIVAREKPTITKQGIRAEVRQGLAGEKAIPRLIALLPSALRKTVIPSRRGYFHQLAPLKKKCR